MDKVYADTVRLLLSVAPDMFKHSDFALKGGTAINLFVRDIPRLSVDIDIAYTDWRASRDDALRAISNELTAISDRLKDRNLQVQITASEGMNDRTLLVFNGDVQVKIEVNPVFRGTVLPVERRSLSAIAGERFSAELELPVLAVDELYGSKLVAVFDRQHPRDLFDVWEMIESDTITDGMVECFVTYLAGHNRPMHEVLFAKPKDIEQEYQSGFVGMTAEAVGLEGLLAARQRLFRKLPQRLTARHREFLIGLGRAQPDWGLLECPHAAELPALRWKLQNLIRFKKEKPAEHAKQVAELEANLKGSES